MFNIKKVGHAGTLDPMATGILPIAVGEATKCISFLQNNGITVIDNTTIYFPGI